MSEMRRSKFVIARLVYGALGLLSLLVSLGAFTGIVIPSKSDVLTDSSEPQTYILALLCSLPFLAIGLALWLRGRYWKRQADPISWGEENG